MWRLMRQGQHQEGEGDGQGGAGDGGGSGGAGTQGSQGAGGGSNAAAGDPSSGAGSGAGGSDWRSALGTDLAKEKLFETVRAKDAADALPLIAKLAVDNHKMVGSSIQLPKKDAKPEDVAKWREVQMPKLVQAGLIEAPVKAASDYKLDKPQGYSNLPDLSEARLDFYKTGFHKLGFSQAQAQGILELHAQEISQGLQLMDERSQDAIDQVRDKWGVALFDRRWALANRAVPVLAEAVGLDVAEVNKYLDATRKGNDPILFQLMAAVGEAIDEDSLGVEAASLGVSGPEDAKRRIEQIRADKTHPWHLENHPRHREALKEFEDLNKLAFGTTDPAMQKK